MSKNGSRTWGRGLCAAGLVVLLQTTPGWSQPSTVDDVVLLAQHELRLEPHVTQLSGHIVVNAPGGVANVSQLFRTIPDFAPQLVADQITIRARPYDGPALFDVFTNTFSDPAGRATHASLTQPIGVPLPLLPFPTPVVVTPGTTNVIVKRATSPVTLPAGDYRDVRVRGRGVLILTGGTYNMRSLRTGSRGILLFTAATTLNIEQNVRFARRSNVGPADPAMNGRCVTINVAGTTRSRIGQLAEISATITAPQAPFVIGRSVNLRGTLTADTIFVGKSSSLQPQPPLTEACL